jgi:murein DD-endopeptidase MepM/ murein hydrolase activator NlpD
MNDIRNKSGRGKVVALVVFLALGVVAGYVLISKEFERVAPTVTSKDSMSWNRKTALEVTLMDNEALKSYRLTLSDGKTEVIVGHGDFESGVKSETLVIAYPKNKVLDVKAKKLTLKVEVKDTSMWNFLQGNAVEKSIDINIDYKSPNVNILSHSYTINQGGAALVIFQADDENLDRVYVEVGEHQFVAQPYKQEGYYASLIAWPFKKSDFLANVVAIDAAQNKRVAEVPFYLKSKKYRVSWIQAKDKFINGKITDLAQSDPEYAGIEDKLEKFRAINETMRLKNEKLIHSLSKTVSSELLTNWKIKKFYPLRNGQRVASYGDERHYYYKSKDNEVSQAYHVGYDLASTKMAAIKTSNAGKVVYADDNGIYGNMPMIDHGLGLYSLYGHCSQLLVNEGDEVEAGQSIAKTGVSGLALGDHLHFGLLVQGIEVRPVEWFDKGWIRKNIDKIFKDADVIIDGK